MDKLISLQQVHKTYKIKGGLIRALNGVDFEVEQGEFVALVGPSGSGKSTLINMITGIDRPTNGEVYVAGQRLTHMNEDQVAEWRGKNVGVVFQFFQLLPSLTVIENVIMPMTYAGTYKNGRRERAMELLELVDLVDIADKYPSQVSGGQQQRAAIARALANDPPLIVGDEPTGNLDSVSSGLMFSLFEDLVAQGKTMVMVTHDKDLAGKVPRVQEVRDGRLLGGEEINRRLVGASAGR
ncbi:MAG TPA: ABC transporter ATP-binding protein [Aggregatilinea sp.]|jgi:putative ABC transport system ATP-binding protein|uniref:ABC transporter ATP-binding protein n=1 Tax=Aggregatilinea sp. TaxID=2806333 RepID=UPI002CB91A78|nr:ABC transporter ATP-binding protein [Aggregatilinea sp.]HML20574.1 ABC transporter ATP-binding protein [Aggregatilinea sp.]